MAENMQFPAMAGSTPSGIASAVDGQPDGAMPERDDRLTATSRPRRPGSIMLGNSPSEHLPREDGEVGAWRSGSVLIGSRTVGASRARLGLERGGSSYPP